MAKTTKMPMRLPEQESSHNVRLTASERVRIEWLAEELGTRGISGALRVAALKLESEMRHSSDKPSR
jgi:hypothetical protein